MNFRSVFIVQRRQVRKQVNVILDPSGEFIHTLKLPLILFKFDIYLLIHFCSPCQAKSSAALQGVCFTDTECADRGGTEDGNCASGFGRCCIFRYIMI